MVSQTVVIRFTTQFRYTNLYADCFSFSFRFNSYKPFSEAEYNKTDIRSSQGSAYAPINIMPHYPPPGRYRGQHRGIDIENQAPDRGI